MTARDRLSGSEQPPSEASGTDAKAVLGGGATMLVAYCVRGALALAATLAVAHLLGKETFGAFVFLLSLYGFLALALDFGLPMAAARLTAGRDVAESGGLLATYLLLAIPCAVLFLLVAMLGADLIARWSGVIDATALRWTALPCLGVFFHAPLRQLFIARGALRWVIALEVAPWLLFLAALGVIALLGRGASLITVGVTYGLCFSLVCLILLIRAAPRVTDLKHRVATLAAETRTYGLNAYSGRTVGIVAYQFDAGILALLTRNPAWVAEYGLAKNLSAPVSLVASSLSTVLFRRFASLDRIPPWIMLVNAGLMALIALVGCLAVPYVLPPFLPKAMDAVVLLSQIWLVTAAVGGISSLMSSWFESRGHGHVLRNVPIIYTLVSVAAQVVLSPRYGAYGAAIAAFLSYLSSVFAYGYYYLILTRRPVEVQRGGGADDQRA